MKINNWYKRILAQSMGGPNGGWQYASPGCVGLQWGPIENNGKIKEKDQEEDPGENGDKNGVHKKKYNRKRKHKNIPTRRMLPVRKTDQRAHLSR